MLNSQNNEWTGGVPTIDLSVLCLLSVFALHKKSNNSTLFLTFHASCLIHDESGGTEETHSGVCGVKGEEWGMNIEWEKVWKSSHSI